ncbi:hypothetical protein BMF94_5867 [Rhodotorula taiwanensis]|uniref:Probable 26S proteasome regulatory subunit p27 n=1 Tax=Rhodotorula taiwanensis TaxID=741276 RepID=A0A2S5B2W6_9BASI|nr:hypothetical protein BMF94_5867 [Rhodotorula taiwanensis]
MSIPDALHELSSSASLAPRDTANRDAPTVQSEAARLTRLKKNIEAQLDAYYDVLKNNNCTMETPLVDREGYPRSDIDVAGVRTARHHVIRLRNDLKAVINDMEQLVLRGLPRGEVAPEQDTAMDDAVQTEASDDQPFAKVDAVAPNSPANQAGLLREDLLVSFGSVSSSNHDNLRAVAGLVGRSEGTALPVSVIRQGVKVELTLTPRSGWGGRGLLGCHIVPV